MPTSVALDTSAASIRDTAAHLGYPVFRPGQEAVIRELLNGRDTLAVMPSGSGKSAIYQIAGSLLPGLTLVVSPLIALQRNQVETLTALNAGRAIEINSSMPTAERAAAFGELRSGAARFIFLAPEQFDNEETMTAIREQTVSLFVVDEAHCISEWGYDFRPHYLALGAVVAELGHPVTLALTATAAPPVRAEIVERLGMKDPAIVVRGFDRPNIHLAVRHFSDDDERQAALLEQVVNSPKPGIVYAPTRKATEALAEQINALGCRARAYHAGLKTAERDEAQSAFMTDDIEVMVATVAFGMGIDKPNVRFVLHAAASASMDAYYQEIGRGGRDGERTSAILFYRPEDLNLQRFLSRSGRLELDQVERIVDAVLDEGGPIEAGDLRAATEISDSRLEQTLRRLEETGIIEISADGEITPVNSTVDPGTAARQAIQMQQDRSRFVKSRIDMMRQYAESTQCRRMFLLNYFGEALTEPCGFCDTCEAGLAEASVARPKPFPLSSQVSHVKWGGGEVMHYDGDKVTILFNTVGYRTLSLDLIASDGLVTRGAAAGAGS